VSNEDWIELIAELDLFLEVGKELKDLGEATWVFDEEVVLKEVLNVNLIHDQWNEVFVNFHYLIQELENVRSQVIVWVILG
jgi:hypothetical protein